MINVKRYKIEYKNLWNEFNKNAKNSIFMFNRNFMEYHSDRFKDHSLMFHDDSENLIAILPANEKNDVLYSHQGLTFGGFIVNKKMKLAKILECLDALKIYLKEKEFSRLIYKAVPYIYHIIPSEEDIYALYRNNAKILKQEPSAVIYLANRIKLSKGKKCGINKAKKNSLMIKESADFETFIDIESIILEEKYDTKPTHTANEMHILTERFPENIKLFGVFKNEKMVAGTILFINNMTVHTQYIASTAEGRDNGAVDCLISYLINDLYSNRKYFDFGISTENNGLFLNEGLMSQKEMFGARTVIQTTYELEL